MRKFLLLIIASLMNSSDGQYPLYPDHCLICADGSIPLSPLSYNTVRSNVFNGTQPSNEGCTNGAIVNGQVTINCGQGTTLIDCTRGFDGGNYSDLSNIFTWNRTTSVAGQVSIVFRFYQQINISRISMFFWNSQSNNIIVPNVTMYWSNDDSILPCNEISITTNSPRRTGDVRRRLNLDINDNGLQFQYLRVVMIFYDDSEWIFLGEVQFCGNTASYNITNPSTDNDVQIASPTATMASVACSLDVTIPRSVTVMWIHNNTISIPPNEVTTTGSTTTLVIRNLQSSDVGVYQCVFNDSTGSGWILRRNTRLIVADPQITYPPDDFHVVTFTPLTNSIQLMCSVNVIIPSSVTVIWSHNFNLVRTPNEVTTTGNTTTLIIRNLQPSDAGVYQCTFSGLYLLSYFQLEYRNITIVSAVATTTTTSTSTSTTVTTTSTSIAIISYPITSTSTNTDSIPSSTTAIAAIVTTTSLNSSTPSTSQSADSSSSSVGVIVAIVVLIVVVIITVVVVGITVIWKRKKSQQHTKPTEGIYYSTIDESTLQRPPPSKPEAVYSEVNDEQDSKEPQYMDVTGGVHSTKQADKVIMQDNPAYSIHQTKDNPTTDYSISIDQQVKMQDNPAYSVANM